ncbi:50S ribosomal subunit protein L16 [Candidatus Hodgkinia cicadicola]|nr:50S ribosomal subunit protein L16 [Candidatus Hodgkinia cicadicola]
MIFQSAAGKHKKQFKGRLKLKSKAGNLISLGVYGLKANSSARIDAHRIEAARKAIMKYIKRIGKLWILVYPTIPVTKKPTEIRMGKGKGEVSKWVFRVSLGRIVFEIEGISESLARAAFKAAAFKLNIKTSFVSVMQELSC